MLLEPSHYRSAAKESLAKAHKPSRVILVHTGAVLLLSLILTLVDHLLDQQIHGITGLGGMDQRSILLTIQSTLRLTQLVLVPFWQIGYTYYTLRITRNQPADLPDLLEGFRRFGPVLRLKLLTADITFLLAIASSYAGTILFTLTPWSASLMREMDVLMASNLEDAALVEAFLNVAYQPANLIPILCCFGVCFLAGGVFLFFRFRLAELWLMDHPESSAMGALRCSRVLMQGNWKAMFKIDLGFWWFYLLELLVTVLGFGDLILNAFGIVLTTDAFGSYILFFCLYIWAQMTLYWWKRNHICITYAHAYMELCPQEAEQEPQTV